MGAKFTKWRAVINIGDGLPSDKCIDANMEALADYAKCAQDNGMVPIVEPSMDGEHSLMNVMKQQSANKSLLSI